jgi:hypothetical protein
MKGFIIENEYKLDKALQNFHDWGLETELFSNIEIQYSALNMGLEMLVDDIIESDAIIVQSTWMYIGQLEDYVEAFLTGKLGPKKFYIVGNYENHFTKEYSEWGDDLVASIKKLCETYDVYEVYFDQWEIKEWILNKI